MHRGYRCLSSLFLTATLAAPVALMAAASPQDNRNQENRQGANNKENRRSENNKRYYDKSHKDYHTWDSNEDLAYQRYQNERHQKRAFVQLSTRQQTVYWNGVTVIQITDDEDDNQCAWRVISPPSCAAH